VRVERGLSALAQSGRWLDLLLSRGIGSGVLRAAATARILLPQAEGEERKRRMITAVIVLHILVSLLLIGAVLLQGGENVDITAAFGGVSQAAFGPRGSVTLLAKMTWVLGVIFMVTSISLAIYASKHSSRSVMESAPAKSAPVTPAPAKK
jgi:preprotein translocase subunit SecG